MEIALLIITSINTFLVLCLLALHADKGKDKELPSWLDDDWDDDEVEHSTMRFTAPNPKRVAAGKAVAAKAKRGYHGRFAKKS